MISLLDLINNILEKYEFEDLDTNNGTGYGMWKGKKDLSVHELDYQNAVKSCTSELRMILGSKNVHILNREIPHNADEFEPIDNDEEEPESADICINCDSFALKDYFSNKITEAMKKNGFSVHEDKDLFMDCTEEDLNCIFIDILNDLNLNIDDADVEEGRGDGIYDFNFNGKKLEVKAWTSLDQFTYDLMGIISKKDLK